MTDIAKAAIHFEGVKLSMSQDKNGVILRLSIHPNDCPPSLHTDWVGSRYMVAMVKLNDDETPVMQSENEQKTKIIQSAGMLCRNEQFSQFIDEKLNCNINTGNDILMEKTTAEALRKHLGVKSRAEIPENKSSLNKFLEIRKEFQTWKKNKTQ